MDSLHTGFDELLYIQAPSLSLTIKGLSSHPDFPGVTFDEKESSFRCECIEDLEDIKLRGNAEMTSSSSFGGLYVREYTLSPIFFEQQRYEIVIEPEDGHTVEFWHENYNVRKNVTPTGKSGKILTGNINFGNDIGFSDLYIRVDKTQYLKLTIEVFPSKISYKDDYKEIVADITKEVYNLVFDFLRKTYESFGITSSKDSSPVEFFAIINKIYDSFISSADMILRNPHHMLKQEHEVLPWYKIKRTDNTSLRWIEKHPDKVIRDSSGRITCEKALAVKKYVTYDTKENRLSKYMLLQTAKRLEMFKQLYMQMSRNSDVEILNRIDRMISGIYRRCHTGFMVDVSEMPGNSGMSLVFSMAPGYRDLYKYYLLLQHGLSVTGSLFNLSVKDIAILYEYWCFIKLNSIMKSKYKLISQDIIKVTGNGLSVALKKGSPSKVKYLNTNTGEKISLSYNPSCLGLPTVSQKPDNILSLEKKGANSKFEYVFDAKYRINPAEPDSEYYNAGFLTPGPEIDTINTMHRYRDAIVYQNNASPYERTMFGAYVLFPYHDEEQYRTHKFYKSIEQVNIGGLPFLPSATTLVKQFLDELVTDSPESAFERATLPLGIEERLAKVDWERHEVLAYAIKDKNSLNSILNSREVLIPENKIANKKEVIRTIAIYQSKSIFGADSGIKYYGEVISFSTVFIQNVLYRKYLIVDWKQLPRPIEAKEGGRDIIYTNMFLLEHSSQILELTIKSEEEYRFYSELKRRTDAEVINSEEEPGSFIVGDYEIMFDNGRILVIEHGEIRNSCEVRDFARRPNAMFRKLMSELN